MYQRVLKIVSWYLMSNSAEIYLTFRRKASHLLRDESIYKLYLI